MENGGVSMDDNVDLNNCLNHLVKYLCVAVSPDEMNCRKAFVKESVDNIIDNIMTEQEFRMRNIGISVFFDGRVWRWKIPRSQCIIKNGRAFWRNERIDLQLTVGSYDSFKIKEDAFAAADEFVRWHRVHWL